MTEPEEGSGTKRGLFCGLLGTLLLLGVIVVAILIGGGFSWIFFVIGSFPSSWGDQSSKVP